MSSQKHKSIKHQFNAHAGNRLQSLRQATPMILAVLAGGALGHVAAEDFNNKDRSAFAQSTEKTGDVVMKLTAGEAALIEAIFGPDFDTAGIRKHYHFESTTAHAHEQKTGSVNAYVMQGNINDIHFPSSGTHDTDFSRLDTRDRLRHKQESDQTINARACHLRA